MERKEDALRSRMPCTSKSLKEHSRPLHPLTIGDKVFLQNQQGPNPNKWDRSGTVVESPGNDQYRIKIDGSGRLTLRNRRFPRVYTPVTSQLESSPLTTPLIPTDNPTPTVNTPNYSSEEEPIMPLPESTAPNDKIDYIESR